MNRRSRRYVVAGAALGLAVAGGWSGLASAAGPPSSKELRKIGSSAQAARTQPKKGFGASISSPLIVISFSGNKATVLGGSAVSGSTTKARTATNIPISAALCSINFTTKKTKNSGGKSVTARWFGGILCGRKMELFGQAFLVESAKVYDGKGSYYKGEMTSATSGRSSTVINKSNPSLYIWHATNVFFYEHPSRGVIAIQPSANQQVNSATSCKLVKSSTFGYGVHCDLYSNRF